MKLGARILKIVTPTAPPSSPAVESARSKLREAHAARAIAAEALAERRAHLQRLDDLLAEADRAAAAADTADETAAEAARREALVGDPSAPRSAALQGALDAASTARRHAEHATLQAAGAGRARRTLSEAMQDAEGEFERADDAVRRAVVALLLALAEPHLDVLERHAAERSRALDELTGLRTIVGRWGRAHRWGAFSSADARDELDARLAAAVPVIPGDASVRDEADKWASLGGRLLNDPDTAI